MFKKLFWRAAGSTVPQKFEYHMNEIKKLEPLAYEHLMERDPKTWCKAFFQEETTYYHVRRNPDLCNGKVVYIQGEGSILGFKHMSFYKVLASGTFWLAGYPCVHGYAAVSSLNRDSEEYVSEWFTTSIYASCYRYNIRPLNCSAMWPEVDYTKPFPPKKKTTWKTNNEKEKGSGKVDLEAELEVEHVVMFESESDSDFKSESDVEANVPEVDVPEPDVEAEVDVPEVYVVPEVEVDVPLVQDNLVGEIQDDIQVDANIEDEIQANIEVEHEIEVQDNVEHEIQHNAENPDRKRTRKTSERLTKIQLRKNIRRKEGSSTDHPLEI
ncbi:unnamed protein product [Lactuca saligna]|uniref:Zinc finger PMZ-type domain-containing protein n=1 Tax=Lactuca saligna TaxID=75948 RepID=A0AA35ZWN3_LACSI|nr:unnamed protein product [Lactuca saligna]